MYSLDSKGGSTSGAPTSGSNLSSLSKMFSGGFMPTSAPTTAGGWQAPVASQPVMPTLTPPTSTSTLPSASTGAPAAAPSLTDALVAEMARAAGYYATPTEYYLNDTGEVMANILNGGNLMGRAGQKYVNLGVPK